MTRLKYLIAAAVSALPSLAWADSYRAPPIREGRPVSIQAYGGQNPACLEWTNGCVVCVKTDGHAACSMPGIACTPAGLTCKRLSHPTDPSKP